MTEPIDTETILRMREHLAINIKKLTRRPNSNWYRKDGLRVLRVISWRPDQDISQAFMLLDTFRKDYDIWINCSNDFNAVAIHERMENKIIGDGQSESLPLAICIACCRATGWEG